VREGSSPDLLVFSEHLLPVPMAGDESYEFMQKNSMLQPLNTSLNRGSWTNDQ
jgi:hypothetical protein